MGLDRTELVDEASIMRGHFTAVAYPCIYQGFYDISFGASEEKLIVPFSVRVSTLQSNGRMSSMALLQNMLTIKLHNLFQHFNVSFGDCFMFKLVDTQIIVFQYYYRNISAGPG